VFAGKPPPTVSWFVNDKLQDNVVPLEEEQRSPGIIVSRLSLHDVRRRQLHNTFKCQASNTKLMLPTEKTVRLDLYRKLFFIAIFNTSVVIPNKNDRGAFESKIPPPPLCLNLSE
jgi:hypothetical protein